MNDTYLIISIVVIFGIANLSYTWKCWDRYYDIKLKIIALKISEAEALVKINEGEK